MLSSESYRQREEFVTENLLSASGVFKEALRSSRIVERERFNEKYLKPDSKNSTATLNLTNPNLRSSNSPLTTHDSVYKSNSNMSRMPLGELK